MDGAKSKAPRLSRKSNDNIIKELEDYVKEKKNNQGKYLDDLSEFETHLPTNASSGKNVGAASGLTSKPDKSNAKTPNMDVYDYCDKMMKDLSHIDKKLEQSTQQRYSLSNNK